MIYHLPKPSLAGLGGEKTTKKLTLVAIGSESSELVDIDIFPGTSVANAKKKLGIPPKYQFYQRSTKKYLDDTTDLYTVASDGEKIEVQPESKMGSERENNPSLFHSFLEFLEIEKPIRQIKPKITRLFRKCTEVWPAEKIGLHAELELLGFNQNGNDFYGKIHSRFASYECYLEWSGRGEYDLLIQNPPENVLSGKHGSCFFYKRDG